MKKLSSVTDVAFTALKNDIRAIQIHIWLMKEQFKDLDGVHLHDLAELLRTVADATDDWAKEKDEENE